MRKNYESIINKQKKQIETQQNVMVDLKNTHISQQSAFQHAQAVTLDLEEQLNQLRSQYNDDGHNSCSKNKIRRLHKVKIGQKRKDYSVICIICANNTEKRVFFTRIPAEPHIGT